MHRRGLAYALTTPCAKANPKTYAGPDTNSTALAVMAIVAAGGQFAHAPVAFFLSSQETDGSFGYYGVSGDGQHGDPDSTAEVVQALSRAASDQRQTVRAQRHHAPKGAGELPVRLRRPGDRARRVRLRRGCKPVCDTAGGAGARRCGLTYHAPPPVQRRAQSQLQRELTRPDCAVAALSALTGYRPGSARQAPRGTDARLGARAVRLLLSSAAVLLVMTATTFATQLAATAPSAAQRVVTAKASPDGSPRCTTATHVPKGQIVVAVVTDFGGRAGRVLVTCVLVNPGVSGAQVLQAQAVLLGYPSPRYAESGLLCAIDGYPTSGCEAQSGLHYSYWAYWHGGERWQYANGGPAAWKVAKGDVEGWRFEPDGSATPADPPPRAASQRGCARGTGRGRHSDGVPTDTAGPCCRSGRQHPEGHQPGALRRQRRRHPSHRRRGAASLPARG